MSTQKRLKVFPTASIGNIATIPSSKPETQRAIIAASLASGASYIYNDLRCLETETMKKACRSIGAVIEEQPGRLVVTGTGGLIKPEKKVIDALGSGLVFRVFAALTCFTTTPAVITGDDVLRGRVMEPLFVALEGLGAHISCINHSGKAPIVNWGGYQGGECTIEGNISSQFITAILFCAPLAKQPTVVNIRGEILSLSYIKQTLETLGTAGIAFEVNSDYSRITVYPGQYQSANYKIVGDYTSSSYLIAAGIIFPGTLTLKNMNSKSLQGERAILKVAEALGVNVEFNDAANEVRIINNLAELKGEYHFDASDYPNIVPTLAAIGAYVQGEFKVTGGSITRLHKSPRIEAMVTELVKMGVAIEPLFKNGVYDGFVIRGEPSYAGDAVLSAWGDHRIFMSLFVASLRCQQINELDGYQDVHCSFPDFFQEFERLGVSFEESSTAAKHVEV